MTEPTIITATDASRRFSDFLNRVAYNGESFLIKKGSRVMAKIVPVDGNRHGEEPKATTRPSKFEERSGEPSSPAAKEKSGSPRLQEQARDDEAAMTPPTIHHPPTTNSDYIKQVAAEIHKMLGN